MRNIYKVKKENSKKTKFRNIALLKALKITLIYFAIGCTWILITDLMSDNFKTSAYVKISIIKGLFYVAVTSCVIFLLALSSISKILKTKYRLEKSNEKLRHDKKRLTDSQLQLKESEKSKSILLKNLPGIAYRRMLGDANWTMSFVSEGCYKLTGYRPEELMEGKLLSFNELIEPKYRDYLHKKWESAVKGHTNISEEYEIITALGETKWVFEQGQVIYDESGKAQAIEGLIIDITERKRYEMELEYINRHDPVSGLLNRTSFYEIFKKDNRENKVKKRAVILINLKKFGFLNSSFGYTYSENLITELGGKLAEMANQQYMLFHISTDRFVFYVKDYEDKNSLKIFCEKLLELLYSDFSTRTMGGNIGIMEIDESRKYDTETVLKNVSIAADNVNEDLIFGYSFFDEEMAKKLIRENEIKNELAFSAFNKSDTSLFLVYQPIVDIRKGTIKGFEALARYKSKKLGIISPQEFIPIAEKTQLIVSLGEKIIRQALDFLKRLEHEYHINATVSVNVSSLQLLKDDFTDMLIEYINEALIDPGNLVIEITESIFSNSYQEINEKLAKIKEMGVKIAIDDFGTGYSSLARERELNVNFMKIDKYFIDKLLDDKENASITSDIISMAHKMGHLVIAEGVEHETQRDYLYKNGCDFIQGFLYGKPVPEEEAIEILLSNKLDNGEFIFTKS